MLHSTIGSWHLSVERTPYAAQELKAIYNRAARFWNWKLASLGVMTAYRALMRHLRPDDWLSSLPHGARVLDCGAGTGALSLALAESTRASIRLDAVDLSPRMLAAARTALHEAELQAAFRQADIRALPYAGGTFDFVMAAHVLEHLPEPVQALREMIRVLKPDGRLLLLVTRKNLLSTLVHLRWRTHRIDERTLFGWLRSFGLDRLQLIPLSGSFWCSRSTLACLARKATTQTNFY